MLVDRTLRRIARRPSEGRGLGRSWIEQVVALDPDGIRLARGVTFLLVTVASGLAGIVVEDYLDIPQSPLFAIFCAAIALNAFLCSAPGARRTEALAILTNCGIAFVVFGVGVVVGWGDLGLGIWPVEITWVAVIGVGLYLRRFGPVVGQYGLMTMLMFMFVTLANPTREMSLWLLLSVVVAAVTTIAVQLAAWRPSALAAYKREVARFEAAVAAELADCREEAASLPPHWAQGAWESLARAGQLALAETPAERPRLQHVNALGLRLLMALKVVTDAVGQSGGGVPAKTERRDFDRLFADVHTLLLSPPGDGGFAKETCETALVTARDDVLADRGLDRRAKFQWLRQLIGLMRMVASADMLRDAVAAIGKPETAEDAPKPSASKSVQGRDIGWRLALQGIVASGITVAIALVFQLDHAYWATMTVFIVLSASLGATIRRTIERAIGTAVGVAIALGIMAYWGDDPIVLLVLAGLVSVPIFTLVERHYMVAAGFIGFIVVLVLHVVEGVDEAGMVSRLYETAIGAGLAVAAAGFVFPIRSVDNVRPLVRRLLDDCREALVSVRDGAPLPSVSMIERQADTQALAAELVSLNSERFMTRRHGIGSARLLAHADALAGYLALFMYTLRNLRDANVPQSVRELEHELTERLVAALDVGIDDQKPDPDLTDIVERWQGRVPLDGSVPAREAVTVIEELYYGRKLVETLAGLRHALARLHV